MPKLAGGRFVFNFDVCERRMTSGAPVDHPISSINQSFFEQFDECIFDRF
jgi:hypothetical protein